MSKAAELAALIANVNKGSSLASKNLIQNGSFQVWQRGTSATAQVNSTYTIADRWRAWVNGGGAYTTEQSTGHLATTGHENALKFSVTTADTSIAAGDYYSFAHRIEAQNLQSLQYGTSDAKPVTLSFWVRATKTGTNTVSITKDDSTTYRIIKEYTISSSNTWEYKEITFFPDSNIKAGGGAIANDNGTGFQLLWILKYGSTYEGTADTWITAGHYTTTNQVNHMDSTSNTFYITGVQLEIGEKATEFEHEPHGTTLQKCHRYFQRINPNPGNTNGGFMQMCNWNDITFYGTFVFPVEKRAAPTLGYSDLGHIQVLAASAAGNATEFQSQGASTNRIELRLANSSGSIGDGGWVRLSNTSGYVDFIAEL